MIAAGRDGKRLEFRPARSDEPRRRPPSAVVATAGESEHRMQGIWVWRRWTRWHLTPPILLVAALVLTVDVVTAWRDISIGSLGRVATSPALPLGVLLACLVGLRRLGLDRANLAAWREFLVVSGTVLVLGVWQYTARIAGFREAMGLVLAALDEELVYRL